MERKYFKRNYKLWAACSSPDDDLQPSMRENEFVYFQDGYALASNTHIAVKVPLSQCTSGFESEDLRKLSGFRIHCSLLKIVATMKDIAIKEAEVEAQEEPEIVSGVEAGMESVVVLSGSVLNNDISITLHAHGEDKHSSRIMEVFKMDGERQPISSIGIRVELLRDLAAAMGSNTVKMRFTQLNRKVYIEDVGVASNASIGVIMPVHIDEQLPGFEG